MNGTSLGITSSITLTDISASSTKSAYTSDDDVHSGKTFWQGQQLYFHGDDASAGDTYELFPVTGDNETGTLASQIPLDGNATAIIDTSDLNGEYVLQDESGNTISVSSGVEDATSTFVNNGSFSVTTQNFGANFDGDTAQNDGTAGVTVPLEVSSNRGQFDVIWTWDGQDDAVAAALAAASPYATTVLDLDDDGTDDAVMLSGVKKGDAKDFDFSAGTGVPAGSYNFTFTVADTGVSSEDSLTVQEPSQGSAAFPSGIAREQLGDVVVIPVEITGKTDQATVAIGGDSVNFAVWATVKDSNNDGTAYVLFNTYLSGGGDANDAVSAGPGTTLVSNTTRIPVSAATISAGDYNMNVTVGGQPGDSGARETDVATLILENREQLGSSALTAPGALQLGTTSYEFADAMGVSTSDSTVARGDWAVAKFDATGLEGYFNASALDGGMNSNGLSVWVQQVEAPQNRNPETIDSGNLSVKTDLVNDTFMVLWEVPSDQRPGDYNVTFHVNAEGVSNTNDVTAANETVRQTVTVEKRVLELNGGDTWVVDTIENNTLMGSTTAAAGTEITVRARATGNNPFLKPATVTVGEDGTFSADFDFSDVPNGTEFTVSTSNFPSDFDIGGIVVEGSSEEPTTEETTSTPTTSTPTTSTPTTTTTTEEPTTEETTTEETTEETTEMTDETTTSGQAGFGLVVALIAVIAAALLALRRRD